MYISVIPTSKSIGRKSYTYKVGEIWKHQLTLGSLVEIPLGKELTKGIVTDIFDGDIAPSPEIEIKPIHSVLSATPLLSKGIISMILSLSEKYYLPIHKALALFLPTPLLNRLEKRSYHLDGNDSLKTSFDGSDIEIHHFVSRTFSPNDVFEYEVSGNVLVFPDDIMLTMFLKGRKIGDDTLVLTNEMSPAKKTQAWIDMYSGKYRIIVGTRKILYYNLSAFKRIIYIEDAFGSEQFQYPIRLRSIDILRFLFASKTHAITIVSSSPTLEVFANFPMAKIRSKK